MEEQSKSLRGFVQVYSPMAKQKIKDILANYMESSKVNYFTDHLLTCLDELIKNGIKANYKFIYIRERIEKYLEENQSDDAPTLQYLCRNAKRLDDFVKDSNIKIDDIMLLVREVLNAEAQAIRLKSKAVKEERKYTKEEREKIAGLTELLRIKRKEAEYDIKLQVDLHEDEDILILSIVNTAPLLQRDYLRIQSAREKFLEYVKRGEEGMFFLENMDQSEGGAGLGYATLDSSLIAMGLEPFESLKIISANNTTVVLDIEMTKLKTSLSKTERIE